jgi:signal transduction histidine kinase
MRLPRFNAHLSVRWKLVLPFLGIALLVIFFLPFVSQLAAGRIQDEADRRLSEIADSVAALIERSATQAELSASFVANLPEMDTASNNPVLLELIMPRRREELGLQELSFYAADFQPGDAAVYYSGPIVPRRFQTSEDTTQIRDELILRVLGSNRPANGIAIAPQSSQIIGVAPVQVTGSEADVQGVILAVFSLDDEFIAGISDILESDVAIVKDNDPVVSTIDRTSDYESLIQAGLGSNAGQNNSENVTYGNGDQYRLSAHSLILFGEEQGLVLVAQPLNESFQVQRDIQLVLTIFAAVVVLVSLLVGIGVIYTFARPLAQVAEAARQVSQGRLEHRVGPDYFLFKDEVTDLSQDFNEMTGRLQELYQTLEQRVADRTRELVEEHAKLEVALEDLAVARDQAVAANQAKTEFISVVSHELRSPMTAIQGYTDLLMTGMVGPVNEQQSGFLQTVRSNVERMARLVSDLSETARIEAGRLHLDCGAVHLPEVVADVVHSNQRQVTEKEQTLVVNVPDDLPTVWGDRMRLAQVMTNLVSNANKYTPSGGLITIQAEQTKDRWNGRSDRDVILVTIKDNGLGISQEDQMQIFQKFFRASDQKAREAPGTGLGLNITKNLIEMQGGVIWFESAFRQGTTFYFTIPLATPMEPQLAEPQPEATLG